MTLITKIPGVIFTDTTLPKLYRDTAITPGTKWAYDALDTYSWPQQAAPTTGGAWRDMSPAGGDAIFSNSSLGFSGGFTKSAAGFLTCPASGKVASNAAGFLFILWLKYGTQPSSGYSGVAGCFDGNTLNQYGITVNNDSLNGTFVWRSGAVDLGVFENHPAAGTIMQVAISAKKLGNGTYTMAAYKNGALVATSNNGVTAIQQPVTAPRIGYTSTGAFTDTFAGTFYRSLFDDTSTLADQSAITALVLKDYNANVGRFG